MKHWLFLLGMLVVAPALAVNEDRVAFYLQDAASQGGYATQRNEPNGVALKYTRAFVAGGAKIDQTITLNRFQQYDQPYLSLQLNSTAVQTGLPAVTVSVNVGTFGLDDDLAQVPLKALFAIADKDLALIRQTMTMPVAPEPDLAKACVGKCIEFSDLAWNGDPVTQTGHVEYSGDGITASVLVESSRLSSEDARISVYAMLRPSGNAPSYVRLTPVVTWNASAPASIGVAGMQLLGPATDDRLDQLADVFAKMVLIEGRYGF
jgi:hypothetical protein